MKALNEDDASQSRLREQADRENRWIERYHEIDEKRKIEKSETVHAEKESDPLMEDDFFKHVDDAMNTWASDKMVQDMADSTSGGRSRHE